MWRNQLTFLESWLTRSTRKPLVIRGARQVGKSTLVRLFALQTGRMLNEVNLERFHQLEATFSTKDPARIISDIEALPRMPAITPDTLLFLDEIQSSESALPALRYLYEERPDLPVVAAGSLLEFLLADHKFSMPVGRIEYLRMGPLVFTEFLEAIGETNLLKVVRTFSLNDAVSQVAHDRLLEILRVFLFVGGMPEAVDQYSKSRSLHEVSLVHQSILDTYRDDFPKYIGSRSLPRILKIFSQVARNLGRKIKYSNLSPDDLSSTIKADIDILCLARVLTKVTHTHGNGVPLDAESVDRVFKLLFLDVGLANTLLGLNWSAISSMSNLELVNEGPVAEQFIGQHLLDLLMNRGSENLYYWLREGKGNNAEVDYLMAFNGKIVPVEVKAGATGSLKSLHQLMGEKELPLAIRMDTNPPSIQRIQTQIRVGNDKKPITYTLISLPLYLVERIPDVVNSWFEHQRD